MEIPGVEERKIREGKIKEGKEGSRANEATAAGEHLRTFSLHCQ